MAHRLREIREKVLELSLEEFAEKVGLGSGKPDKWYLQRVQRIETGQTRLNEDMIDDICKTFPHIEPWHFFKEPTNERLIDVHSKLLYALGELSEPEQEIAVNAFVSGLNISKPEIKKNDIKKADTKKS